MNKFAGFRTFVLGHRETHDKSADKTGNVISPVIQHSTLGAHGGLGDFVAQTATLFPKIEWAVPLTEKVRQHIGDALAPAVATVPIQLNDPVSGEPYRFYVDVHPHVQDNGSLSWLFYCAELMEPFTTSKPALEPDEPSRGAELDRLHRFYKLRINQNGYQEAIWTAGNLTVAKTPGLRNVNPLLRRYYENPDMLNAITQGAIAKAIVALIADSGVDYDVAWVHDWHFAAIAGELLLPARKRLAERLDYIQHLHNALYQGIYPTPELITILGWPREHFDERLYRVHGQFNLLGGALNALRYKRLNGKAVAVSRNHAAELPTVERGAGLHQIFDPLARLGRLAGIDNPITVPKELPICSERQMVDEKPELKEMVQHHFNLARRPDAFLLLWSHRFTHQKQVSAVLHAVESLLKDGHDDLQIAFFCDIFQGSSAGDVDKLHDLIDRYPDNVATDAFQPKDELLVAAGVDGALMASYFEPFGYAPIWVGMQGGFIVTAANGGQVDIFDPETTFFLDIRPDIDKPQDLRSARWDDLKDHLFVSGNTYRRRIFKHNTQSIRDGILRAKAAFQNRDRSRRIRNITMRRMFDLANGEEFTHRIEAEIFGTRRGRFGQPGLSSGTAQGALQKPSTARPSPHTLTGGKRRPEEQPRA